MFGRSFSFLHPWKLTCPQKRDYFSREYIFQPLIFRGHVSFQGSKCVICRFQPFIFQGVSLFVAPSSTPTTFDKTSFHLDDFRRIRELVIKHVDFPQREKRQRHHHRARAVNKNQRQRYGCGRKNVWNVFFKLRAGFCRNTYLGQMDFLL